MTALAMPSAAVVGAAHARPLFLIGCVALVLAWQLPGHYPPWVAFQQEMVAAVGAALIGWAVVAQAQRLVWPRLALLALAVAGVPLAQRAFGLIAFNSTAILATLYVLGFALAMVAGATMARTAAAREFVPPIVSTFAVGACISALLAMMQWQHVGVPNLWITDLAPGMRPYANFAQPNHLATLLACGVGAFVFAYESRRLGGVATSAGLALLGIGLLATQSRTSWLFVAVLVGGGLVLRRRAALRTSLAALCVGGALFVLGVLAWAPLNEAMLLTSHSLSSRLQAGPRQVLWPLMLAASLRRPWFGYGWNQSGVAQFDAALDFAPAHYYFQSAHNVVLDLLLWNGWPIGLLVAAAIGWWFWRRLQVCRSGAGWALLAAVLAAWLHALVEYPLSYAYFLLPIGLLMGIVEGSESSAPLPTARRLSLALPLAVACAFGSWAAMEYVEVEASMRVQRFVLAGVGIDKVDSAPRPDVKLLDAELALLDLATAPVRAGMSEAELAAMARLVALNAFPRPLFRYATALALNGRTQEAAQVLDKLCRMNTLALCAGAAAEWRSLQAADPTLAAVPAPSPLHGM